MSASARKVPKGRLTTFETAEPDTDPIASLPPRTRASVEDVGAPTKEPTQASDTPAVAGKGPKDRVRPSNVHIPVALLEPLEQLCDRQKITHGEAIIIALEETYPRLAELIQPAVTAGGKGLFASRRSQATRTLRSADGPLTPLNYRLREGDFETIDHLVEQFGALSRGHLITVALQEYLHQGKSD